MIHLDKENFKDLVKKGNHLVDFYAEWCGPCKMMGNVLETIEPKIEGKADIIKINIDNFSELAEEHKVMSIPTLVFYKDGEKVDEEVGFSAEDYLLDKINEVFK